MQDRLGATKELLAFSILSVFCFPSSEVLDDLLALPNDSGIVDANVQWVGREEGEYSSC